jgi:hypothetical protein
VRGANLEVRGANLEVRGANLEVRGANLEVRAANVEVRVREPARRCIPSLWLNAEWKAALAPNTRPSLCLHATPRNTAAWTASSFVVAIRFVARSK